MSHRATIRPILAAALVLVGLGTLAFPMPASAHPLGNFTVNHFTRLTVERERIAIHYVLDMAEIPTYTERAAMDVDGDGSVASDEEAAYRSSLVPALVDGLQLSVAGRALELRTAGHTLAFPTGQGARPPRRPAAGRDQRPVRRRDVPRPARVARGRGRGG